MTFVLTRTYGLKIIFKCVKHKNKTYVCNNYDVHKFLKSILFNGF